MSGRAGSAAAHGGDAPDGDELANQLALRPAADVPLVPRTQRLLRGDVAPGTTRRRGCGVCRPCLFFPQRLACVAAAAAEPDDAAARRLRSGHDKRARVARAERELSDQRPQADVHARTAAPQTGCRLCKVADHSMDACPLRRMLGVRPQGEAPLAARSGEDDDVAWSAALDAPTRAVLTCVQQLAAARVHARSKKRRVNQCGKLAPADLRRVEAALQALLDV